MAELLIIAGIFLGLGESAIVKRYKTKHGKGGFVFTAILALFSMMFFLVTDADGFCIPAEIWWYAVPSGIFYAAAYFFTFVAFGCGPFAISVLIISYSLVFSTGYGLIVLNETATPLTYMGLLGVMLSIYFVRGEKGDGRFSLKWFISIIIVWAGNGLISVLRIMQQIRFDNAYNNDFMVVLLAVAVVFLFVIGFVKEGRDVKYIFRYGIPWGAAAGVLNGIHNALSMIIITLMPVSISSPLTAGIKIIITFIFSGIVYKERYNKRQLMGVALGGFGVILLKL